VGRGRDAVADNRFDLALVPVAGVGDHDGGLVDVDGAKLALRRADHRLQVAEVARRW